MNVQHVYGEVIGCQVHGLKDLLQGELLALLGLAHLHVRLDPEGLLNEPQQMLLVHARRGVDVGVNLKYSDL